MDQTKSEQRVECGRSNIEPEDVNIQNYVHDKDLNRLLKTVVGEVKLYAKRQISQTKRLAQIGTDLSAEKNINRLLESIVKEARKFANADAGTLYTVDKDKKELKFEILQNETMNIRMGGTSGIPVTLPPIPMEVDGKPNYSNVSSFVASSGEIVNIPDVYCSELFDFTGPKEYDMKTGYRSRSMLVVPLKNHENDIIGVLQLLNAIDPETNKDVPFSGEHIYLIASLASQASVALTNAQLVLGLKTLLQAFIKSIALAIDAKSPFTGCHIKRVVSLSQMIADHINTTKEGCLGEVKFSEDQFEELRMAAWMHDIGKITTSDFFVAKRTKLEAMMDRIEVIRSRFDLIAQLLINEYQGKLLAAPGKTSVEASSSTEESEAELAGKLEALREDFKFVEECNTPNESMDQAKIDRVIKIGEQRYLLNGVEHQYLTREEIEYLSIRYGSLTAREREKIEEHALMSMKLLDELPFPKHLANVPKFAGLHHEKLDGSGYPFGLKGEQIPLEARIIAIADIFEALTAPDRPYRGPIKLSEAIKILDGMRKRGQIDSNIYDLFVSSRIYREYGEQEMRPEQLDEI